ncbi:MAG: glycosyltransferase [Chloroflexi bacterium]|nr:glycosyltransferase [Chloroflexota bacterium]
MKNLKIVASHPVQYHAPFFKALTDSGLDIEVGYYHAGTAGRKGYDPDFGRDIQWDIDLLAGYPYRIFLNETGVYSKSEQIRIFMPMFGWALQDRSPLLLMGWFVEIIWLIWFLAILFRVPILLLCEMTPGSYAAIPKPAWRIGLLRWLVRHTDAGLFIGSQSRRVLTALGLTDERLFPTPYSVDNERFASAADLLKPQRARLCREYGLDEGLPTFLFCGKLIPKKHPLELLEAYHSAGLGRKAQLVFVGEGVLRARLEARVRELGLAHVRFLGFLNQSQMPLAYVLGHVLCLFSEPTETWGLVVNEAMACGRPVIVSDATGCAVDLVGKENGWIVPLHDQNVLVETLKHAYESREFWEQMGNAGREKISRHTFAHMVEGVRAALDTVKDSRGRK